jgi:hypothetical protein
MGIYLGKLVYYELYWRFSVDYLYALFYKDDM